jgi:GTP cyclohydrolase II
MGIVVNQRVALTSDTNKYNEKYISTKIKKLGHLI